MTIIFKAKTSEGYVIKVLVELLQNTIKTAGFEISETGIRLRMMDSNRIILSDVVLLSENFSFYKFKPKNKVGVLYTGINLNHFHKMLKAIKKKDSVQLYIDDKDLTEFAIKVIPKEKNRITTSFVKIQAFQSLNIDLPTGYGKPIIIPSGDYQKTIKEMSSIGNTITVVSKKFNIKFKCNAGGVMKKHVEFGEADDTDDESEDEEDEYHQNFETEHLYRITKIAALSSNIQIYLKNGLPLFFRSSIGTLGKISIYIKSKNQLEQENCTLDSDEDDF